MQIKQFPTGPLATNGYLLVEDKKALVIDPSLQCDAIIEAIKKEKLELVAIVLTHAHFDHFFGIFELFDAFGSIPLYAHKEEKKLLQDAEHNLAIPFFGMDKTYKGDFTIIEEGKLSIAPFKFEVFHTPGHTPGGINLYDGSNLFTGDTLFAGSIGRTDLGSYGNLEQLTSSIKKKLFTLPSETIVWTGHGEKTTIGREKRMNPYFS